VYTDNGLTG